MPLVAEVGDTIQKRKDIDIEWKIRDFLSLSDKVDDFYESQVFSFAGAAWRFKIYPNGETNEGSTGYVSLFLAREDSGAPKSVCFTFRIKGTHGVEKSKKECEGEEEDELEFSDEQGNVWGHFKFWSRTEFIIRESILLPNNELTVICHIRSNTPCTLKGSGENKVLKSLLSMLENGDDSDFIIKVQGKEFPAHRSILRARSSVFKSMLSHDMLEKQNNVVNIEDCDPDTFPDFLVHIYSGSSEQISSGNVLSLYILADKYDVEELKEACADFMKRNISVSSFCDTMAIALKHDEQELIDCATKFFCDNTADVVKTVDWQIFLKDNVTVGNELFLKAVSKSSQCSKCSKS